VLKNNWPYPALLGIAALLIVLQLVTESGVTELSYQRQAILAAMPWRLISGHFVHANLIHMAMNLAALILLAGLIPDKNRNYLLPVVIVIALLSSGFLLLMEPQLEHYVGLSGVLHGLSVVIGIWLWREHAISGPVLLLLLLTKIVLEQSGLLDTRSTELLIGMRVATEAHLWGAVSGVTLCAMSALAQRLSRALGRGGE
tara:strand:+ start:283 stop:882 length:600 start_codon:yes stop_codon:yes gene_type:complete